MSDVSWDDGTSTDGLNPFASGNTINVSHAWMQSGVYTSITKARDSNGVERIWFASHSVSIDGAFINLSVQGGFCLTLYVNNIGESPLENSSWGIHVASVGNLGLVFNSEFNGGFPSMILPGASESIRIVPIGLSKINISAVVYDCEGGILASIQKYEWLLGVFVFIRYSRLKHSTIGTMI